MIITIFSCADQESKNLGESVKTETDDVINDHELKKIAVLNFGTFHMGMTSDASKTEFDENDRENKRKVHEIAKMLSSFNPTVIIVETRPESDEEIQLEYNSYLKDPEMNFKNPSEVELLAYELGRISNVKRIYGIDHKMGYNYNIANEMENDIDDAWCEKYYANPLQFYPEVYIDGDSLNLLDKLKYTNHDSYLDFLITVNADMLSHVGSEKGFEGADEAAKYYQRNLRMYSNLNRIKLTEDDHVFILMGASHTAFFRDFISRSPKYRMVNTLDYLK